MYQSFFDLAKKVVFCDLPQFFMNHHTFFSISQSLVPTKIVPKRNLELIFMPIFNKKIDTAVSIHAEYRYAFFQFCFISNLFLKYYVMHLYYFLQSLSNDCNNFKRCDFLFAQSASVFL